MTKRILPFGTALLVILTLYGVSGYWAKQQFQQFMEERSQEEGLQFEWLGYTWGLFSSKVSSRLMLNGNYEGLLASLGITDDTLKLDYEIAHGPLYFGQAGWNIGLGEVSAHMYLKATEKGVVQVSEGEAEPFVFSAQYSFMGDTKAVILITNFSAEVSGTQFQLSPGKMDMVISKDQSILKSDIDWQGLTFQDSGFMLSVQGLTFTQDYQRVSRYIMTGKMAYRIDGLKLMMSDYPIPIEARDIEFDSQVAMDTNKRLLSSMDLTSGFLTMSKVFNFESAELKVTANGIQADAFDKFLQLSAHYEEQLEQESPDTIEDKSKRLELANQGYLDELAKLLPSLLEKTRIQLSPLRLSPAEGDIQLSLMLHAEPITELSDKLFEKLVTYLRGDFELSFPKALISDPDMVLQLRGFMQQGYLLEKEGLYYAKGQFLGDRFTINSKTLPLETP